VTDPETDNPIVLKPGAVALVDALGFRGIWCRCDPALIVRTIRETSQTAIHEAAMQTVLRPRRGKLHVASFSDTLLLGGTVAEESSLENVVRMLASAVAGIQSRQVSGELGLNYRGCISVGRIAVGHDYSIGEAVDDAARLYEQAQAAVIWLTPATRSTLDETKLGLSVVEWAVPLKGGGSLKTLVVNPFAPIAYSDLNTLDLQTIDALFASFQKPFTSSKAVDVAQKAQKTYEFLCVAREFTIQNYQRVVDAYYEEQSQLYESGQARET